MPEKNTARETLDRARFFLEQAVQCDGSLREEFSRFLETAIIYARSVTLHLKKQYAHTTGFQTWYSEKESQLRNDPLCQFFVNARNYILKEGILGVGRVLSVTAHVRTLVIVSDLVRVKVKRGNPWYRRSLKIIWEDLYDSIVMPIRKWNMRQKSRPGQPPPQPESTSESVDHFYFDDPKWKDRPALDLLRDYLDKLEAIVVEVEKKFGVPSTE
jgi:hypothetical protein